MIAYSLYGLGFPEGHDPEVFELPLQTDPDYDTKCAEAFQKAMDYLQGRTVEEGKSTMNEALKGTELEGLGDLLLETVGKEGPASFHAALRKLQRQGPPK